MEKIAIVRRNGLGDLLCALPLYRFLKDLYPEGEITFFVDHRNAPLFTFFPEKIPFVVFPEGGNKYLNLIKVALKYRKKKFDLAISAKTSPMKLMNFFLFFLGAKKRVAVVGKGWHSNLINQPQHPQFKGHQALKSLQLIDPQLTQVPHKFYPHLKVPPEMKNEFCGGLDLSKPLIVLSASTTRETSRLNEEQYAACLNQLSRDFDFNTLIISHLSNKERANKIASYLRLRHQVVFPKSFNEFITYLSVASLIFVGDGGIAHIGAALQKRQIVLFGQVLPEVWGPLSDLCTSFYHPDHVNLIDREEILGALRSRLEEVLDGKIMRS